MVNQDEVDRLNFAGRLHPSQRWKVLHNFLPGLFLVAAGILVVAIAPKDLGWLVILPYLSPVFLMIGFGLWVCVRRLLELIEGRLVSITGWTHDDGMHRVSRALPDYPIVMYTTLSRGKNPRYNLKVAGRRALDLDRKLHARIQPERNNTVFFTTRTKRIINAAPTP